MSEPFNQSSTISLLRRYSDIFYRNHQDSCVNDWVPVLILVFLICFTFSNAMNIICYILLDRRLRKVENNVSKLVTTRQSVPTKDIILDGGQISYEGPLQRQRKPSICLFSKVTNPICRKILQDTLMETFDLDEVHNETDELGNKIVLVYSVLIGRVDVCVANIAKHSPGITKRRVLVLLQDYPQTVSSNTLDNPQNANFTYIACLTYSSVHKELWKTSHNKEQQEELKYRLESLAKSDQRI